MKEVTKEWLGLKTADFFIYLAFIALIGAYFSSSFTLDVILISVGSIFCFVSCRLGMVPHPELGKINNALKLVVYPACCIVFIYFSYLNLTQY